VDDRTWERLLESIRENNVVPVLGPRLLVGADGTSIQKQIASSLLRSYGRDVDKVSLTPFRELNDAVSHLKGSVDLQELYFRVHSAIREVTAAKSFVIPEPIRQLSEIADFRVLVTLTPDDLLARSLRMRCEVNEIVHSPNLPDTEESDLPRDWRSRPGIAYVLYLFGKSRTVPMFAIHEEDVLEYAHNMITRTLHVPTAFLNEIQERSLLLIGCNFPEWLSRFFLRATNQRRLSEKEKGGWLIDPLQPEESLTRFLRGYSRATEILSQLSPAAFVAELRARWGALHDGSAQDTARSADEAIRRGPMFFISYSRTTDLPKAEQFYQSLIRQGLTEGEVWFDRHSIEPGGDFQRSILDGIRRCRYFVPLLSSATNDREEGFVFSEWNEANLRYREMNREFVFPVIVDTDFEPERYNAKPALKWADEHLDFGHAPGGVPDGRLQAKIRKLVREIRKEARPS
jgi:hypothetical protein